MKNTNAYSHISLKKFIPFLLLILLILLALMLIGPSPVEALGGDKDTTQNLVPPSEPASTAIAESTPAPTSTPAPVPAAKAAANLQTTFIKGQVFDQEAIMQLSGVKVALYNAANQRFLQERETLERGVFVFKVPTGNTYQLISSKEGYYPDTTLVEIAGDFRQKSVSVDIDLRKENKPHRTILSEG